MTKDHLQQSNAILPGSRLRITRCCHQGGRKYMEDCVRISVQRNQISGGLNYIFVGVFDGHGGSDAAIYAKDHLLENIVAQPGFTSENDDDVLGAIKEGYLQTHLAMWKEVENWARTASGYTSTSGTTASVAFIRNGKLFTGHVGDSAIVIGNRSSDNNVLSSSRLTVDHKPDCPSEMRRIEETGGEVMMKAGVMRVVWQRPRKAHQGPIRRSTCLDRIPFLAVARSLGDLWSYNSELNQFVVSPEPDVAVHALDRAASCLLLGSDGLWNVVRQQDAVHIVNSHEWNVYDSAERREVQPQPNVSKWLVRHALLRWGSMRADNISVVAVVFDHCLPDVDHWLLKDFTRTYLIKELEGSCDIEQELLQFPDSVVRVSPMRSQLLESAPVELMYFGALDVPVSNANNKLSATTENSDFDAAADLENEGKLLNGTDCVPLEEKFGSNLICNAAAAMPSSLSPSLLTNGKSESSALRQHGSCRHRHHSAAPDEPVNSRASTRKHWKLHRAPWYFCSKHGLQCEKVKRFNSTIQNDGSTVQPINGVSSWSSMGKKPKYWCRKHGLSCERVRKMNETGVSSSSSVDARNPSSDSTSGHHGNYTHRCSLNQNLDCSTPLAGPASPHNHSATSPNESAFKSQSAVCASRPASTCARFVYNTRHSVRQTRSSAVSGRHRVVIAAARHRFRVTVARKTPTPLKLSSSTQKTCTRASTALATSVPRKGLLYSLQGSTSTPSKRRRIQCTADSVDGCQN